MFPQHLPVTKMNKIREEETLTQNGYQNNLYCDTKIDIPKFRGDIYYYYNNIYFLVLFKLNLFTLLL